MPNAQTHARNILRQKGGPHASTRNFSRKQIFQTIMSSEIRTIILRESNQKAKQDWEDYNTRITQRFLDISSRPPLKEIAAFSEIEFDAFIDSLIMAGIHRSNRENLDDMWSSVGLPLIRAAMFAGA